MENKDSENPRQVEASRVETLRGEVHESRSRLLKGLLLVSGCACLGLGVMGVVLPILPTTPFLLLAAICFARSSEPFYIWLLTNRYFGTYIRDWRENKGLTIALKLWVIFILATTIGLSITFFVSYLPAKIILATIGLGVTAYIWSLPTKPSNQ